MKRQYMAEFDDGHDYFEVIYTSEHRNHNKQNREDAIREMHRTKGWHRHATLVDTWRYEFY